MLARLPCVLIGYYEWSKVKSKVQYQLIPRSKYTYLYKYIKNLTMVLLIVRRETEILQFFHALPFISFYLKCSLVYGISNITHLPNSQVICPQLILAALVNHISFHSKHSKINSKSYYLRKFLPNQSDSPQSIRSESVWWSVQIVFPVANSKRRHRFEHAFGTNWHDSFWMHPNDANCRPNDKQCWKVAAASAETRNAFNTLVYLCALVSVYQSLESHEC